jgi:radical SAM-linked protein
MPAAVTLEPRQRWRLVFRRRADAPPLQQKELLAAWQDGLVACGLPFVPPDRPRLSFAAALQVGMAAEHELVDILLSERLPVDQVRLAIVEALPVGHELIELHDVWLGEPPLPGQTAAADYRIVLADAPDAVALSEAAARLLASSSLVRPKPKGGGHYDLRPLLDAVEIDVGGGPVALRVRTRFDPERGAGRPDEVVAALAELAGAELSIATIVRERVVLSSESERPLYSLPAKEARRG